MIIMFIVGLIVDHFQQKKWEKEHKEVIVAKPSHDCRYKPHDPRAGYKVRMDIPYRGKYNDIY